MTFPAINGAIATKTQTSNHQNKVTFSNGKSQWIGGKLAKL
jgi:hypothetical protein